MRTLIFLLRKEFKQIFRDKAILAIIFVMPSVQLIIMPLAANYEVKKINLAVVDNDKSTYTQKLISQITSSGYFRLQSYNASYNDAYESIKSDKADLILEIPHGFERNLVRENKEKIFVAINAINGTKANLGGAYLSTIIGNFNNDLRMKLTVGSRFSQATTIEIASSNWFNMYMNYRLFFVPGILAILVTLVGSFLTALNIVREKEVGTIEQINVTPIKKHHFILGKLIPFWVLANVIFTIGLLLGRFVYGISPVGNFGLLYLFVGVYLLAALGLGLLISTFADTQQQAMLIMFFFMMVFILMGGLFTPIESMPQWAQIITKFNPVRYFIEVMRMVILKGSTLRDVASQFIAVILFAIVLNSWAILNYKKRN
ncbi:ABC transporter permease [Sporocytophaga myxococcoides]|uniref:ABC transporter permease n=1 Tax=Sporocytophaga myxococcoides TaxID=153721 RepID=A0A098L8N6_9BACT|nr:ABC transporter permease [Sporocytophaga myxococcoides]GAL83196.1 ABC transporter permease [Sporocytophaga myxococcoides]